MTIMLHSRNSGPLLVCSTLRRNDANIQSSEMPLSFLRRKGGEILSRLVVHAARAARPEPRAPLARCPADEPQPSPGLARSTGLFVVSNADDLERTGGAQIAPPGALECNRPAVHILPPCPQSRRKRTNRRLTSKKGIVLFAVQYGLCGCCYHPHEKKVLAYVRYFPCHFGEFDRPRHCVGSHGSDWLLCL